MYKAVRGFKPKGILLFFWIYLSTHLSAALVDPWEEQRQLSQFKETRWTIAEGLPTNLVNAIVQTRDGYLWMAGFDWLARFNGTAFEVWTAGEVEGLRGGGWALAEGPDGSLWVGSNGGGLVALKDGAFEHFTKDDGLPSNLIRALVMDETGTLWIGTAEGLCKMTAKGIFEPLAQPELQGLYVLCMHRDKSRNLWIGSRSEGLLALSPEGRIITRLQQDRLPSAQITSIDSNPDGSLWVGTSNGLVHLHNERVQVFQTEHGLPENGVSSVHARNAQEVIFLTNGGLSRLRGGKIETLTSLEGLADDLSGTLFEDREGNLWLGTWYGGVIRLRPTSFLPIGMPEGLSDDLVYSFFEDLDGGIWIGTNRGLNLWQNGKAVPQWNEEIGELMIRDVHRDRQERLWIASNDGLYLAEKEEIRRLDEADGLPSSITRALLEDRSGSLWVGTRSGLARLVGEQWEIFPTGPEGLSNDFILSLHEDREGTIWIGTNGGGLNLYQPRTGLFQRFKSSDGLASDVVFRLHEDQSGNLWVCTNGGLSRISPRHHEIRTIRRQQGLLTDTLFQILEDPNGRFWMSTNNGLATVLRSHLEAVLSGTRANIEQQLLTDAHGLRASAITGVSKAIVRRDGTFLIPTPAGAAAVNPLQLLKNPLEPPVFIENVTINGKPLEKVGTKEGNSWILPPDSRNLFFAFTVLSYIEPEENRMKSFLEGFDENWIDHTTERTRNFTQLDPGNYRFLVRGANNDGIWNDAGETLYFRIEPYFHQTTGFKIFVALALIFVTTLLFRLRVAHMRQRNKELARLVEERTATLRQQADELQEQAAVLLRQSGELALKNREIEARENDLRLINKELETTNQYLDSRVRERTKELQEALHNAQAANRAKSQFLAMMSHEIRTPLNAICGMNAILLEGQLDKDQRHYAETALRNAQTLLAIITDILDLTRIEVGKMRLIEKPFNLFEIIADLSESFAHEAHQKGLSLSWETDDKAYPWLLGDPLRVRQVLSNLLSNAVKFTPAGSILVRYESVAENAHEAAFKIRVRDTGIGISQEQQERLFEAFEQGDASFSRKFGGAGLGLSITQSLVHLMGGTIEVESEPAKGSTFIVSLRLPKQNPPRQPGQALDKRNLIICTEPDPKAKILARQLQFWGAKCIFHRPNEKCPPSLIQSQANGHPPYDLLLSDLTKPVCDPANPCQLQGACQKLAIPTLSFLVDSTPADSNDSKELIKKRYAILVNNPFSENNLYETIEKALQESDAARKTLTAASPSGPPPSKTAPAPPKTPSNTHTHSLRILLAEDVKTNQEIVSFIVRKMGHQLKIANDGMEACGILEHETYDLVLMDIHMPNMDGVEATRRIRDPQSPVRDHQIPIIAVTANAMQGDRERLLAEGMDDYIPKPVNKKLLFEALQRTISLLQERGLELSPNPQAPASVANGH